MAITSCFTRTSYSTPDTQQRKSLQPVSAPPTTTNKPNLSPTAQVRQPVPALKDEPKKEPQKAPTEVQKQAEKSNKRFALRLTQKQRAQIKKLKKSWGLSTESAVIKKLIDDSKEEQNNNDLALQISELTAIKTELNRIGVNVNQIAKKANQVQMSVDDLNAIFEYLEAVCDIIYGKGLKQ